MESMSMETETAPLRTSVSAINEHRRCPQRYAYGYLRGLERAEDGDVPVERDFGTWWHALRAAEAIERGRGMGTLRSAPKSLSGPSRDVSVPVTPNLTAADALEAAETWWQGLSGEVQDVWLERLGGTLSERLEYVDARWRERWAQEREHEAPLAVELRYERALPALPASEGGASPGAVLSLAVDEVYLDGRRGMVVVRDHKTHRDLATRTSAEDMMESQLQVYAWAISPLVEEWGHGPVRAVAYDRVRSVAPKSPALTLSGTLSKAVTDYDLHTYVTWAAGPEGAGVPYPGRKKDGSGAGVYVAEETVIESLSDPAALSKWQQRTLTPLNRNVVRAHLRAAVDTAFDIAATIRRFEARGEAGRNMTSACRWCDFADLCRAEMMGGPDGDYDLAAMGLQVRHQGR